MKKSIKTLTAFILGIMYWIMLDYIFITSIEPMSIIVIIIMTIITSIAVCAINDLD